MADEEHDESQIGDETMTGPGAPTPVSALEVRSQWMGGQPTDQDADLSAFSGTLELDQTRYSVAHGWRLPNGRVDCLHTKANA